MVEITLDKGGEAGAPLPNALQLAIEGPTRIGYYFSAQVWPADIHRVSNSDGPVFVPDGVPHKFAFTYDPQANSGQGALGFTLDDAKWKHNLTKEQRAAGARFDRFGVRNLRRGGKYVEVYFDDLAYTVRRDQDAKPVVHPQEVVKVPYPPGGRKY